MESASEVDARIATAEQIVAQKAFEQDRSNLINLANSLQADGWSPEANTPPMIVRLASVMRRWGSGLRDKQQDPEPLFTLPGARLQEAVQKWPDDPSLLNEQGTLFYVTANYQSAFDAFDKVIKKGSVEGSQAAQAYAFENAAAALRKIRIESRDNVSDLDYQKAQELLDQALKVAPENVKLLNEQGELYYEQSLYDQAHKTFQHVLGMDSILLGERVRALEGFGSALSELGRYNEADDAFQQAFSASSPPSGNLLVEYGWLKFYQGQYDLAYGKFTRAYQTAIETNSEEDQRYARIGLIASSHEAYVAKTSTGVDKAEDVIKAWERQGLQPKAVLGLLFECDSILTFLNLYPAAFRNNELILGDHFKEHLLGADKARALRAKIESLKWLRRYDEAEELYRAAQNEFPMDVDLWKEMGNIQYRRQCLQKSYEYYSGRAINDPGNAAQNNDTFRNALAEDEEAREWTIVTLRRMRKLDDAEKRVNEALISFPNNRGIVCEKAYIYFTQRKFDEAIALFDRALRLDEYYNFAHQWRAASYRKKLQFDKAREMIEEALSKVPGDAGIWEEKAWLAFDQNELEKADEYFAAAIKLDPYVLQRRFSRVEVLTRLNRNEDAEGVLLQLGDEFKNDLLVTEQLGWFYLRRHDLDLADTEFSRIEKADPESVLGINGRGGYHLEQSEYVLASNAFRLAIQKVDHEPQFYINRAWATIRQVKQPGEVPQSQRGKRQQLISEARSYCRKALDLDLFESKAHNCMGVIAFTAGSYAEAERHFMKSIELSPMDGGHLELGSLYVLMGRYTEAEKELKEAIKLNRNDARGHIEMASLLLLQDNAKESVRYCRYATALEPANQEAHRALAIALMRTGQYEEAEKTLRKALNQLSPAGRWSLHLVLAQILIRFGDDKNKDGKQKDVSFYGEAFNHVSDASRLHASPNADVLFHAGIANYKLNDLKASFKSFNDCLQVDHDRYEAERYRNSVQAIIEQERKNLSVSRIGGLVLAVLSVLGLLLLWSAFALGLKRTVPPSESEAATIENRIRTAMEKADASKDAVATAEEAVKARVAADLEAAKAVDAAAKAANPVEKGSLNKIAETKAADAKKSAGAAAKAETAKQTAAQSANETLKAAAKPQEEVVVDRQMLTVYTPMLFGLFVIALLLPNLSKLKLFGGIEAEIAEVKTEISTGPKGDVGFGSSMTIISPGPR